jgi:hypothetical protein
MQDMLCTLRQTNSRLMDREENLNSKIQTLQTDNFTLKEKHFRAA